MGHFTLTNLLLPLLKAAATDSTTIPRIVTVASAAAVAFIPANYTLSFTNPTFLSVNTKTPLAMPFRLASPIFAMDVMRYSLAKLANIMVNVKLQRLLDDQGLNILCMSVNPGAVKTEGGVGVWAWPMKYLMKRVMVSEDEGSWNSLFAATAKDVQASPDKYRGQYLDVIGKVTPVPILERNEGQIEGLWEVTTDEINKHLGGLGLDALA
ncbi:hypothetical protein VHEMI09327 [[Torrubiella] hemipterigena]|uniref:Uncharacterized protein n=1 Tax=[Torrubiella] hemipterigena TaxID=1531966 RepID=A0A0A1TQ59_9HYPO|nr:hypothetical protein VHEMI09327 [[Torrubiella] hemipterigena]